MATLTETIGRVLSDRYRIEAALGTGASAHVYVATDVTLKRRVAIKMLHPVLAADRAFLRRFRAEAQAAASLAHPNLVAVHDWGEDADGPYLVLEYLGGGSMRDLLDSEDPLQPAHVANIGAQAAHGLAYAHARGFVHRDVKPANLLFAEDRKRLCVADFGLARALAEAAWTEPVGATLGTARYAAPEQAEGKRIDGRADVYSLSLVLYEALTGVVPFGADTTIGTLMARVNAPLPPHSALGPLEAILRAAAAPDPEERLTAAELARRLSQVVRELPSAGNLPNSKSPRSWRPYEEIGDHTHIGETANGTASAAAAGGGVPAPATGGDRGNPSRPAGSNGSPETSERESADEDIDALALAAAIGVADEPEQPYVRSSSVDALMSPIPPFRPPRPDDITEIGIPASAQPAGDGVEDEDAEFAGLSRRQAKKAEKAERAKKDGKSFKKIGAEPTTPKEVLAKAQRRRKRWPFVVGIVLVLLAGAGAGAAVAVKKYKVFAPTPTHKIVSLVGLTPAAAQAVISKDHFHLKVTGHTTSITAPTGTIITQTPAVGHRLAQGKTISVITSSGLPSVAVPPLAGITAGGCPAVTEVLNQSKLKTTCSTHTSITVKAGGVISYQPTSSVLYGSTIKVVISTGLPQVAVPNLTGMSQTQITNALNAAHFTAVFASPQYSSTVANGQPISWTGQGKTLLYGSSVTVTMSQGHAPVLVPSSGVAGATVSAAEAALEASGLTIQGVYGPTGDNTVVYTVPAAGDTVPYGTPVSIYVNN